VSRGILVANAPVSFGAFELTAGTYPEPPPAAFVLDEVAGAGYEGIDLGPIGYLGRGGALAEALASRGLSLCGGYLELPFSDPAAMPAALHMLADLLDVFDAASTPASALKPKPTLADAGSDLRRARPCQSVLDHKLGLDSEGWKRFADGVEMAAEMCRGRGYEATLHHEPGTFIEAPWEITRALELTSIGLCLDTGHLVLGGGDPLSAARDWRARINHVHLKDAHRAVADQVVREGAPAVEIWRRNAFCRLGEGDARVDAVLDVLRGGYSGWLVAEQDTFPGTSGGLDQAALDQRANREFLAARDF
jgi:inosose dehydratase